VKSKGDFEPWVRKAEMGFKKFNQEKGVGRPLKSFTNTGVLIDGKKESSESGQRSPPRMKKAERDGLQKESGNVWETCRVDVNQRAGPFTT